MRRIVTWVAVAVGLSLLLAEATMQPSNRDRLLLLTVFALAGVSTVGLYRLAVRFSPRFGSVGTLLGVVAVGSVAVTAVAVALAAQTMFLSPHDRNLVFVALILGVGLGVALSITYARSITRDLEVLESVARSVEAGDYSARVRLDRSDELGTAGRAVDAMVANLEATSEERRRLLTSISHDLRTPLASIQAAVEALEDGLAPDPAAYLRGMGRDISHLVALIDDLFLLAKVESGLPGLRFENCDLTELVDEAVEALGPLAAAGRVKLKASGPGRATPINADAAAVGRVLRNLLHNAIRHAPAETTVTVTVHSDQPGFSVIDAGPGFPEALGDAVFDRFVTGDGHRPGGEGSGLGLAICKGIVDAHGGDIRIGGGPGGHIEVTLPPLAGVPLGS